MEQVHTHARAHAFRHICTNTFSHTDLNLMTGICAAVYWHNPWLQCSLVKSCRAESLSDAHFLFSPIDYSFLLGRLGLKLTQSQTSTVITRKVCVCQLCMCGFLWVFLSLFPCNNIFKQNEQYVCIFKTKIYKCLWIKMCVCGQHFSVLSSPWRLSDMFDKWEKS